MKRTSGLVWVVSLLFAFKAFGASNVETGQFDGGAGRILTYILSQSAAGANSRLFVFVQGDGSGCTPFDIEAAKKQAQFMAVKDAWVMGETARDALCASGSYQALDFFHRATEVINLVNHLVDDPRFQRADVYLVGHSAGPQIVARAAKSLPSVKGLVLIEGDPNGYEIKSYYKLLLDGYRTGVSPALIKSQIQKVQDSFAKIRASCSTDKTSWDDRSDLFWCQMSSPTLEPDLLSLPATLKVLLIHGLRDDVIPVEETYNLYAKLLGAGRLVDLKIYPDMDHNMGNFMQIMQDLSAWANGPSL